MNIRQTVAVWLSLLLIVAVLTASGCSASGTEESAGDVPDPQLIDVSQSDEPFLGDYLTADEVAAAFNRPLVPVYEDGGTWQLQTEDMTVQVALTASRMTSEFFEVTAQQFCDYYDNEIALSNLTQTAWWGLKDGVYEMIACNGTAALDITVLWSGQTSDVPLLAARQVAALFFDRV